MLLKKESLSKIECYTLMVWELEEFQDRAMCIPKKIMVLPPNLVIDRTSKDEMIFNLRLNQA